MRQLVFALVFKGSASPGTDGTLHAKTTASSQVLRTDVGASAPSATVEPAGSAPAAFESEVRIVGDGAFVESGRITYGSAGSVRFRTVGNGVMGASGIDGLQRGAVIWEVASGDGQLAGATGLITSNFTVNAAGAVVDHQFAMLFVP